MSYDSFSEECATVKEHLIYDLSEAMREASDMDLSLFTKYDVKRGLEMKMAQGY